MSNNGGSGIENNVSITNNGNSISNNIESYHQQRQIVVSITVIVASTAI
ncbi:hypothetical protein [Paenibacillus macerans]